MAVELSPALLVRTRRFAPHSRQSCASSPRLRCIARTLHRPTPPTNGSLHRPRGKTGRTKNQEREMNHPTAKTPKTTKDRPTLNEDRKDPDLASRAPFYHSGLRPSPLPVFGSTFLRAFEKFLKKGRFSTPTDSLRVSTNRERAASPFPVTPAAEKKVGETHTHHWRFSFPRYRTLSQMRKRS